MRYKFAPKKNAQISSLSAAGVVATNQELEVELLKSYKQFTKKPVCQLETIPELRIIVTLSDGLIYVNSLEDLLSIQIIQKTKGATCFATNLRSQPTLTGELQHVLRMCVVIKRKVILFYWKNKNFHEMSKEINLQDQPRTISWFSESLCVGYRSEYNLIKLNQSSEGKDEIKQLPPTGSKQIEPTIKVISDNKLSISKEENTYILDLSGESHLKYSITWSDIPLTIAEDYPYLIALLPSSIIEVRTIEPLLFIQRLELAQLTSNYARIKILSGCARRKGLLIAATNSDIFAIVSIPIDQQKAQMINEKHYELALNLANMESKHSSDDDGLRNIELQYAHDLFHREQYKEALELFLKLDLSPLVVIDLYPELSDKVFTQQTVSVDSKPDNQSICSNKSNQSESNEKITALIDYLIQIRRKISTKTAIISSNANNHPNKQSTAAATNQNFNQEHNFTFQSHFTSPRAIERLKQEVDTTLLKCYLLTTSALVAPLLRLPDNHCKLQVTEKGLIKYHKYNELIILYKSRGLHRKSLELLKNHFQDYPHAGLEKAVQYLQNLGYEHMEIICEYAKWVLQERPEIGLKIFTADQPETEQLDRQLVLEFLHHNASQLVIPYLEHIIHIWSDKTPLFHNTLLLRYRQKVASMLAKYVDSLGDGESPCPAGKEPLELGVLRRKLLDFLEISDYYSTEGLPTLLLNEGLCEERAIVVGKLGKHEEALSIFIYVLDNPKRAEEYCESEYKKKAPNSRNIFFLLLKLYLHPPESLNTNNLSLFGVKSTANSTSEGAGCLDFGPRIVRLLNEHGEKIDPIEAINELPSEMNINLITEYLSAVFRRKVQENHEIEIFRQLVMSKFYRVQKSWIKLQQANKVLIEDSTICQVCTKRIGRSAFVRFPNFDLVHYSCKDLYGKVLKSHAPGSYLGR